jgi:hypothetical protein
MSKRICAWCGRPMGNGNGAKNTETHGICKKCLVTHFGSSVLQHIYDGLVERHGTSGLLHGNTAGYRRVDSEAS